MSEQVFQTRYETYRTAVESYLETLFAGRPDWRDLYESGFLRGMTYLSQKTGPQAGPRGVFLGRQGPFTGLGRRPARPPRYG